MIAEVGKASWLLVSTVGEKINMTDWKTDAGNSRIRVNYFNIFGVVDIQPTIGVLDAKQRTSRIKSLMIEKMKN